jgi:hypothetical protein
MKRICWSVLLLLAISSVASAADCNRACLKSLITKYVDAMVAHKPESLPLAANARFTEDSKVMKLGEGLWQDATRVGTFRQDYIDLKKQIAASHVEIYAGEQQVLYSVVLHTRDQKITGIESLVDRIAANGRFKPDSLTKPLPVMSEPVPAGQRLSREDMKVFGKTAQEIHAVNAFFPHHAERYETRMGINGPCPESSALGSPLEQVKTNS